MRNYWKRGHLSIGAVAMAFLAGCGGGSSSSSVATIGQTQSVKVESRAQPESVAQDVARVKNRDGGAVVLPTRISLPIFDSGKSAQLESTGGPRQIGEIRMVESASTVAKTLEHLQWQPAANGGTVAAISIAAEEAHGLRLGILVEQLPGSAILRIYRQDKTSTAYEIAGQEVLHVIDRNLKSGDASDAARTWWSPDTGGDEATIEIELPPDVPTSAVRIAIPRASHIFTDLSIPTESEFEQAKINESDACNLDATCYDNYASQRNAVARMVFTREDGRSYLCSGTLMNDRASSGTPYFLSANHCISSQTVASTLTTYWFYRSPVCNSRTLSNAATVRNGGATLLYASGSTDTSFMRLNDTPPAGAVFAGWNAGALTLPSSVVGIHHPQGDLQKISFGSAVSMAQCTSISNTNFSCSGASGNFYRVTWSQGTTEGGSSGSAIFAQGYVVGTLYGGSAICSNTSSSDFYGRFDVAFNAALNRWLSASANGRTPIFRFYNARTGAHFYTADVGERNNVITTLPDFRYEGPAFYAYASGTAGGQPVFRFFNQSSSSHFYTISPAERDYVIANLSPTFRYEGATWYAQPGVGNNATPVYRFYRQSNGTHFYTVSPSERDNIIQNLPDFRYEASAYYAWGD